MRSTTNEPTSALGRDKYTCEAKCHVLNFSNVPNYGTGYGGNRAQACQAAVKDAQGKSPFGTYTRHCDCKNCQPL